MDMSINFPHLGISLEHVGKSISVFGFSIAYYGIVIACGMLIAIYFITREAKNTGQDQEAYLDMLLWSIVLGIVGARIYYVVFDWSNYKDNLLDIFNTRQGGLAIYGGIIAGVATACIFCKKKKMQIPKVLDTACFGLLIGQIMGRWGNFFNREAFGGYTDSLFAMQLPVSAVRQNEITSQMWEHAATISGVQYVQVHPTFLYESLWNLCLFLLLYFYRKHKKFQGEIFLLYLTGYGLGRVWIEQLRTDQLLLPGIGLPVSQVLSALLVLICSALIILERTMAFKRNRGVE